VYVKASAWFRVSGSPYPHADAAAAVRKLVDTFGPERVLWGSDFPWVTEQYG
jgi:predicted TIM-barrel fold metal-dependent hydrolase